MLRFACLLSCLGLTLSCANAVVGGNELDGSLSDGTPSDSDANSNANSDGGSSTHCETVPSGWSRVGSLIDPPGGLFDFGDIAVDSQARPVVIFSTGAPANGVVYRFDGSSWSHLGAAFNVNMGTSNVYSPSLRALGNDLVAMFVESGGSSSGGVYIQRYSDAAGDWEVMGGGDLSTTNVNVVGLDMLVDGTDVLVAWSQYSEGFIGRSRIHVRRFSGEAYVPLNPFMGGIAGPGASSLTPALAIDGSGTEVVLFSESGVRHLRRNSGNSDWDDQGEVLQTASSAFSPKVTTDAMGRVVMVMAEYNESADANQAFVQRWNGSSWEPLGAFDAISTIKSHSTPTDILMDENDQAIIAMTEIEAGGVPSRLFVGRRDSNGSYSILGGRSLTGGDDTQGVIGPRMAKDECGFYIAFAEAVDAQSERTIHVFRWKD